MAACSVYILKTLIDTSIDGVNNLNVFIMNFETLSRQCLMAILRTVHLYDRN